MDEPVSGAKRKREEDDEASPSHNTDDAHPKRPRLDDVDRASNEREKPRENEGAQTESKRSDDKESDKRSNNYERSEGRRDERDRDYDRRRDDRRDDRRDRDERRDRNDDRRERDDRRGRDDWKGRDDRRDRRDDRRGGDPRDRRDFDRRGERDDRDRRGSDDFRRGDGRRDEHQYRQTFDDQRRGSNRQGDRSGPKMSVEDKKKLLWGNKAKVTSTTAPSTWQEGSQIFVDSDQQHKFLKLIGVKEGEAGEVTPAPAQAAPNEEVIAKQAQMRQDLEQQYALGLKHNISRTGLY